MNCPTHLNGTCGIYRIVNSVDGKAYVGSSSNVLRRLKEHRRLLRNGHHHSPKLQHAWTKYGEGSFFWELLLLVEDPRSLAVHEQRCIDDQAHVGLYTCAAAALPALGLKRTPETLARMSRAQSNRSLEWREKNAAALQGRKVSPEAMQTWLATYWGKSEEERAASARKVAEALQGRKLAPEALEKRESTKRKNREAAQQEGRPYGQRPPPTKESVEKRALKNRGRKHTEEAKANMSAGNRGRPRPGARGKKLSPERITKQVEARKRNAELRKKGLL